MQGSKLLAILLITSTGNLILHKAETIAFSTLSSGYTCYQFLFLRGFPLCCFVTVKGRSAGGAVRGRALSQLTPFSALVLRGEPQILTATHRPLPCLEYEALPSVLEAASLCFVTHRERGLCCLNCVQRDHRELNLKYNKT